MYDCENSSNWTVKYVLNILMASDKNFGQLYIVEALKFLSTKNKADDEYIFAKKVV